MWSWVVFVRPSKRRLIASRERPQRLLLAFWFVEDEEGEDFLDEEDGWCRVKTATPAVTKMMTRYL